MLWLPTSDINTNTGEYTYLFGNGYVSFNDVSYSSKPVYHYYTKDHLGNVRSVVKANTDGTITEVQRTAYYPFGGIIPDLSMGRKVQSRFYNSKEMDFANNLNWLDYGARQYDPARGQFIPQFGIRNL